MNQNTSETKLGFFAGYGEIKRRREMKERRQKERAESFSRLEQKFTQDSVKTSIIELGYEEELINKLQSRELKAVEVLSAYIWKALEVTKRFNCITEFNPKMMEIAEALDALPEVKGSWHGIPFCVKDDTDVEGMDTTLGCSAFLETPKEKSAVLVEIFQDAGAIPFCKTNVPQAVFSSGSVNPIYGKTLNPWNEKRSPGGSSSGTGCLVAAGGAVFGTGSDYAGSVRVPSHFCGISTLHPTPFRNSVRGHNQIVPDESAGIHGQIGLMAGTAKLVSELYKTVWKDCLQNKYDAAAIPVPWNAGMFESKKSLKIGYFTSLPFFPSFGDTANTVLKAKERLEALGHTLVEFELPDNWYIMEVCVSLVGADECNHAFKVLQYEDEISVTAKRLMFGRTIVDKLTHRAIKSWPALLGTSRACLPHPESHKSDVLWDHLKKRRQLESFVLDKMKSMEVDALLSPVYPFAACGVDDSEDLFGAIMYTVVWNLLGFTAGVVPFGTESGESIPLYDDEGDAVLRAAKESMKDSAGMPIGVQLIGKPFNEEMVLRLMCELFPFSTFPGTPRK